MTSQAKVLSALGAAAVVGAGLVGWWWSQTSNKTVPAGSPTPAAPSATATTSSVSPYEIAIWDVQYRDAKLGLITGKGIIDWEHKKARIELTDPQSGAISKMSTRQFDLNDTKSGVHLSLELAGSSPSSQTAQPQQTTGLPTLATTDGAGVLITPADPGFHAVVHDKAAAELNRVHVTLQAGPTGELSGMWSYQSDPLTERDRNGSGRNGAFSLLNADELESKYEGFLGLNAEVETWAPRPPAITAVAVLEEQTGYDKSRTPMFPYPFSSSLSPERRGQTDFRTLMIVGHDLPVDGYKLLQKISFNENDIAYVSQLGGPNDAEGITQAQYRVLGVKGDPSLEAPTLKLFEQGWQEIGLGRSSQEQAELRKLDAVLVRVTLKQGALPGAKTFTWGGGIGSWGLQFGDATAEARFVRKVRSKVAADSTSADQFERTSVAYLPESIIAEVETSLPFESLKVMYTLKSNPNAGGSVDATQIRPGLYHATINLLEQSGRGPIGDGVALQAAVGDEVLITVDRRDQNVEFVSDPLAALKIARSPGVKTTFQAGKLWKEELSAAASCKGIQITDWSTVPGQKADEITNTAVFQLKRRKTIVTIGEHAAMLLLRDTFTDMLERQKSVLLDMTSDEAVRSYREGVKRTVLAAGDSPMSTIKVTGPSGGKAPFIDTLDDDYGATNYTGSDAVSRHLDWQLQATREAVAQYAAAIDASTKEAAAIDSCDIQGLLKLTGAGFQNVVNDATPRLMKLADTSSTNYQWVPDLPARSQVAQLKSVAETVRNEAEYTSIDHDLAIGIALAPLGLAGKVGRVLMSGIAVLQLNVEAAHVIWEHHQNQEEVQFEFGASSVLGAERLAAAEMKKSEWWVKVAMLAGNGVLTAFDLKGLASEMGTEMSVASGRSLWPSIDRDGVKALRNLAAQKQRQVMEYLAELRLRIRTARAVSVEDGRAIIKARAMAAELEPGGSKTAILEPFEEPGTKTGLVEPFAAPGDARVRLRKELPLKDLPHENGAWIASGAGTKEEVILELGKKYPEGAYSTVFDLLDDAGHAAKRKVRFSDGTIVDSEVVVKILSKHANQWDRDDLLAIMERMRSAQQELEQAGIEHFPIVEFHPEGAQTMVTRGEITAPMGPYLVQPKIPAEDANFRIIRMKDFPSGESPRFSTTGTHLVMPDPLATVNGVFLPEQQEAYVRLIRQLADNNLIGLDLSLPNVYFKRVPPGDGGKWIAGILDIDHIVSVNNPGKGFSSEWAKDIANREVWGAAFIFSDFAENPRPWLKPDGTYDAEAYMEKMFEFRYGGNGGQPFIRYNSATGDFDANLIDPKLIRKYFPKMPAAPKVPKKSSYVIPLPRPFRERHLAAAA